MHLPAKGISHHKNKAISEMPSISGTVYGFPLVRYSCNVKEAVIPTEKFLGNRSTPKIARE